MAESEALGDAVLVRGLGLAVLVGLVNRAASEARGWSGPLRDAFFALESETKRAVTVGRTLQAEKRRNETPAAVDVVESLCTSDVARILGVSLRRAQMLAPGLGHKVGGRWVFDPDLVADERDRRTAA